MDKQIVEALWFRYATKRFDSTKKVSEAQLETILEALRLTPTSYGLHLMKVVVVSDKNLQTKLLEFSDQQNQVVDASHVLVLCRENEVTNDLIDNHFKLISETQNRTLENLEGFKSSVHAFLQTQNEFEREAWLSKQLYIALGNLMTVCAMLQIDSCPMEGFNPIKYDEILGLDKLNLSSVLVVPIGYRHKDDYYSKVKKVRRPIEKFVVRM